MTRKASSPSRPCLLPTKVTIDADTKITIFDGEDKKGLQGKEALKNEHFTPGAYVTLMVVEHGKVVEIVLVTKKEEARRHVAQLQDQIEKIEASKGEHLHSLIRELDAKDAQVDALKKQLEALGAKSLTETAVIKKVDAEQGIVTVTAKPATGGEVKDLDITIGADTKVAIDGEEKQGKEGLKNEKLKEGASVKIKKDKGGKIVAIVLGNPEEAVREMFRKLQKNEPANPADVVRRKLPGLQELPKK